MYKFIHLLVIAFAFNFSYSQNNDSSITIEQAIEKAKVENKQIFVNYYSTECELSNTVKQRMTDDVFKTAFNTNYIVVDIVVPKEETSDYVNCSNPIKTFNGTSCKEIEFPFWYILDSSGEFTNDSFKDSDKFIGYPSSKEEMNIFLEVLTHNTKKSKDSFVEVAYKM